jgi:hypothetical protein
MSNDSLSQRDSAIIGRGQMMSIDIEPGIFQTFCDKREKKNILENPSTEDNPAQLFHGLNPLAGLDDKGRDGSVESPGNDWRGDSC